VSDGHLQPQRINHALKHRGCTNHLHINFGQPSSGVNVASVGVGAAQKTTDQHFGLGFVGEGAVNTGDKGDTSANDSSGDNQPQPPPEQTQNIAYFHDNSPKSSLARCVPAHESSCASARYCYSTFFY